MAEHCLVLERVLKGARLTGGILLESPVAPAFSIQETRKIWRS